MPFVLKLKTIKRVCLALVLAMGMSTAMSMSAFAAPATWTAHPASDDIVGWRGVTWAPELGIFVAVGSAGTGIMTSPDGINWTTQTTPSTTQIWRGIAWSPELHLFAVVGNNAGTSVIMTSPDGINWTLRTAPTANTYMGVVWSPEQSKFVATISPGSGSITSPDGITWTAAPVTTMPAAARNVIWVAADSQYVAVRSTAANIYTSPDGVTWTQRTSTLSSTDVAYSPVLDRYTAVGASGIMTSPDGIAWTTQTSPVTNLRAIEWSTENNEFAAVGPGGIVTSPDGITWTEQTAPSSNIWEAITWSPQLSRYVATSTSGTDRTMVGLVPTVPQAPLNLAAVADGANVKLTWIAPTFDGNSALGGYRIERRISGGAYEVVTPNTSTTTTSFNDTTTQAGAMYTYRIYALNGQGQSDASNEAEVTIAQVPVAAMLADTGINQATISLIAVALVVAGVFVLMKTRRTKSASR